MKTALIFGSTGLIGGILLKLLANDQKYEKIKVFVRSSTSKIDPKISIATVYRTVKLFEEAGILTKHDFKGGKARYEELNEGHHDHLIDVKSGEIIEFVDLIGTGFDEKNRPETLTYK